jgi:hypothetical protein
VSNTQLKDNPAYTLQGTFNGINIYIPADISNYHMSRYVQLQHQLIYANAGTTAERLNEIADAILQRCNLQSKLETRITDIGVLANEIKYRTKYPVDENCSIRIGAVLSFMDGEDPDKYDIFWTRKKEELAMTNSDAYSFFLSWGISNIEPYRKQFDTSISLDYFSKRREALASLTPQLESK